MKTLTVGVWLFLVAAPLWAEDDGGAPAPQPVIENPAAAQGVYDQQGNRLGNTIEEVQAQIQAQAQAEHQARIAEFQQSHPDPGNGSGFRDMQGNFMGKNAAEAAAAGFVPDPRSPAEVEDAMRRHGTKNIYYDEQTGDWHSFNINGKNGITREEFFAEKERSEAAMNALFRKGMNEGRGKLGENVDRQMDETIKVQEQMEKDQAEALAREKGLTKADVVKAIRSVRNENRR